jgi:O-antigen ligase
MSTIGQQKVDGLTLTALAVLIAVTGALSFLVPVLLPWAFLAVAAAALLSYWAIRWEITLWAWLWVLSFGMFDAPFWRWEIPGFFNMTIERFMFLAAVSAFVVHLAWRRDGLHFDRPVLWAMLALLVWCAISAQTAGWVAHDSPLPTSPYFRFLGSLLFPFTMFFLVYTCARRDSQIRWALIPLTVYGWYALYIAYLQYAAIRGWWPGARAFIWPAYINQPSWGPTYGIHFDRARGAYTMCNPQAILLVTMFYADLFLIRRLRSPYRAALVVQAILIPPAIFFTGLRSGYLSFLLAGIVWLLFGSVRRAGKAKLALAGVALMLAVAVFWTNLASQERATGGVAQTSTIIGRWVLAQRTWEIVKQHPLFGVGFGHYLVAEHQLMSDPAELTRLGTGLATPHNLFLVLGAETGLIGVVLMAAVIVLIFRESVRLYHRLPPTATGLLNREYVVVFWAVMTAYFTDAMLVDPLWDVASSALFWSFAGLMVGYNRLLDPHPLELPLTAPALTA